jgi:hypothetical protein
VSRHSRPNSKPPSKTTQLRSPVTHGSRGDSARRAPPGLTPAPDPDPGGNWARAIRKLAEEAKVNAEDLLDEWAERAAIKTYLGCIDLQQANAEAFELVRQRLFPQTAMFDEEAA